MEIIMILIIITLLMNSIAIVMILTKLDKLSIKLDFIFNGVERSEKKLKKLDK